MTSADPLADERFRTIVSDTLRDFVTENYPDSWFDDSSVSMLAREFPEAHFEYRTNEAGVRLRKVVVESGWEVDPLPAWMDGPTRTSVDHPDPLAEHGRCTGCSGETCACSASARSASADRAAPWHA
jgi:hypothetical protein